MDTVDNRVMVTVGDKVFLEMNDLAATKPGDVFELIAMGPKVFTLGLKKNSATNLRRTQSVFRPSSSAPWKSRSDPTRRGGRNSQATREIKRGSKLRPYTPVPDRIPRLLADKVVEGYILSDDIGKLAMGQWEVILIDIGEEDGLQVGHELDLYRQREPTERVDKDKHLILPDIDLGDAIVLEVRQGFAEALITRTTNLPIYRGDQVRTKTK